MRSTAFKMVASPPFRLDLTVWALRRRAMNNIDRWDNGHYSRIVVFGHDAYKLDISQQNEGDRPTLQITLSAPSEIDVRIVERTRLLITRMLGPTIDLGPFYLLAEKDDVLRPLVREFRGVKPPRFPTLFEALVNAIACQQVSLDVGIRILNRFSERFGTGFGSEVALYRSFPQPDDISAASEEEIKSIGLSLQKARAIKEIANDIQVHEAALAEADRMDDATIVSYLSTIKGIGRWSAEYVMLRGLGRLDVFPGDDVGARNNLQRLFDLDEKPDYSRIKELTAPWAPYQGLVYFHLLLDKLRTKGVI